MVNSHAQILSFIFRHEHENQKIYALRLFGFMSALWRCWLCNVARVQLKTVGKDTFDLISESLYLANAAAGNYKDSQRTILNKNWRKLLCC